MRKYSPFSKIRRHSTKVHWQFRDMRNEPYPQIISFNLKEMNKQTTVFKMSRKTLNNMCKIFELMQRQPVTGGMVV